MGSTNSGFYALQSLVKVIIVAFYKWAKISEHGDTKLVELESNENIVAKTFIETK